MRLALSTHSAPGTPTGELVEACLRKGFPTLELAAEPGGGPLSAHAARVAADAAAVGIQLAVLRAATAAEALTPEMAALSARLGVPVLAPPHADPDTPARGGALYGRVGASLLLTCPPERAAAEALRDRLDAEPAGALGLAWEVVPGSGPAAGAADPVSILGPHLKCVRLRGAGPEVLDPERSGIGEVMMRLALARYAGPIVLLPSTRRFAEAWRRWLGRSASTGCGSRAPISIT